MRKRKVITRSGASVRGYFWSHKSRRLIPWESQLERRALLVMDSNPKIAWIREYQQETLVGEGEDSFTTYPDYIAGYVDGSQEIVEVKSDLALKSIEVKLRLSLVAVHFQRLGMRYRVLAEQEICRQPRLENLERLATFRRPNVAPRLAEDPRVKDLRKLTSSTTVAYVASRFGSVAHAHELIANGVLRANLDEPLALSARVEIEAEVQP
jgi:hypothetical protein